MSGIIAVAFSLVFLLMLSVGNWDKQLHSGYINIDIPDRISQRVGYGVWDKSVRGDPNVWLAYLERWELSLTEIGVIVEGLGRKQRVWF